MSKATDVTVEGNVLFPNCCPACMAPNPDSNIILEHKAVAGENAVTLFSGRVTYNVATSRVPYCKACIYTWVRAKWFGRLAFYGGLVGTFLSPVLALLGVPIGIVFLIRARTYDVIEIKEIDEAKNAMTFSVKNKAYAEAMMQVNTLSKPKEPAHMLEMLQAR